MITIGPELKAAREKTGISTVEAARRLHMRAMFVEALERDDWKTVGEPVYVRGFIRNYARMLRLDEKALVAAFNQEAGVQPPPDPAATYRWLERRRSRFRYPWLLAALSLCALFLVGKVVWTIAVPSAAGHGETHPQTAAAFTSGVAENDAQTGYEAAAPPAERGVNLRLTLTQSCWLSVAVDGKRVIYKTLPAGTVREFHAVREITLRAGNAGGVVATIDGQALGALGHPGQVEDRVFAVRTPAPGESGPRE
jgi:cytoskeletal protein RodZ